MGAQESGASMSKPRAISRILRARAVVEGAGVHLHRAIGFDAPERFDPFLLLDDFPLSGPPRRFICAVSPGTMPRRGMETITYVLRRPRSTTENNLGNAGVIGPGDVQWMSAGSGIVHQEMPKGEPGGAMCAFQLWANLPAANKMSDPRYRGMLRRHKDPAR